MKRMKITAIVLLLLFCIGFLKAQDIGLILKEKMDFIFQPMNKNNVETGLLTDYGCMLVSPYAFNGILSESNYVSQSAWKSIYMSMYTARINNNAVLEEPKQVYDRLRDDSPALLYLQYNRLDDKALDNGLLTFQNGQLHETGHPDSIYLKKVLFAAALPDVDYYQQVSFIFRQENYISNIQDMPVQLAICFTPESGYRTVSWGETVSHTFISSGEKEIGIRIRFVNGKTLESHTRIRVVARPVQLAEPDVTDATYDIPATSGHSGGKIQIKYATFNTGKKELLRPLIIADESDLPKFFLQIDFNLEYLLKDDNTRNVMEWLNQLYDLVYVDNNDGFADIFRNARLFEDAMLRINRLRNSSCDQSYVVGLGMGGLVARYALKEMENQGKKHNVCKFITVNSPHKGLNFPVGLQALFRHMGSAHIFNNYIRDIFPKVVYFCNLFDRPAMKQMLIYSVDASMSYRGDHTAFMNEFEAIGLPGKCRNVAISNGSSTPSSFTRIFEINYETDGGTLGHALFDSWANTVKQRQASQVYYGKLHTKGLFDITFSKKTLDGTNKMYGVDDSPGSYISIAAFADSWGDKLSKALKATGFCLVPTGSALGLDNWGMSINFKETPFDKVYMTNRNNEYMDLIACKDFLMQELAPQISESNVEITGNTTFQLENVPELLKKLPSSLIGVKWQLSNNNFKIISSSNFEVVVTPLKMNATSTLKAKVTISSLGISYETFPVALRSMDFKLAGSEFISPAERRYSVSGVPSGSTLTWTVAPNLEIVEKKDNYIVIKDNPSRSLSNPLWIQAKLENNSSSITRRLNLRRARVERAEMECLEGSMVTDASGERKRRFIYRINIYPADIPASDILRYCWLATASKKVGIMSQIVGLDVTASDGACTLSDTEDFHFPPIRPVYTLNNRSTPDFVEIDRYEGFLPPNYINIKVPSCQYGDSILGVVKASVCDNYDSPIKMSAPVWNYYVSVPHLSPNPAGAVLTLSWEGTGNVPQTRSRTVAADLVTVNLYNDSGPVRSVEGDPSQSIHMNVSDLLGGTYYVNILKGGEVINRQVVVIRH